MPKFIEMEDGKNPVHEAFSQLNAFCLVVTINMKNHLNFIGEGE